MKKQVLGARKAYGFEIFTEFARTAKTEIIALSVERRERV